jgi:SRSO17 transposase
MKPTQIKRLEQELGEYLDSLISGMGRPERRRAMGWYVTGLLLDGERKSIEPIAARLVDDASEIEAMRQRLQQAVTISTWSDREILGRLARKLDRELPGVEALIFDDTGHPKKGTYSVGVARQYSGTLGRVDNCQVAVSLHLAGEGVSGCIAYDLYLPEVWASDAARRRSVGVPDDVVFRTKWQIALQQLDWALAAGVRKHLVLADAGYGDVIEFRDALRARGLDYVVGVNGQPAVWPPESDPKIPPRKPGKGHPPTRYRDEAHPPETIEQLAKRLRYRKLGWRQGSRGWQTSRFAAVRIRTAHHHVHSAPPGEEQWLLCEWPADEKAPTKYWLATLPKTTSMRTLVRLAKLRWRVERDYQEMKQELGLDHFEGRTWRGFHHHAALCAVAHGFLALQRALFPPEETEVDVADGAALPAAGAPAADRLLPALSASG